jgi:hypothetical protein
MHVCRALLGSLALATWEHQVRSTPAAAVAAAAAAASTSNLEFTSDELSSAPGCIRITLQLTSSLRQQPLHKHMQ